MKNPERELKNYLPKYCLLTKIIRQQVKKGKFVVGRPLPSITSLMEEYQVSQNTVRQAIAVLVREGVLYTDHGRGTFVRPDHNTPKRSGLIGVLVPDIKEPSLFAGIISAMEEEVYRRGNSLIVGHTNNNYSKFKNYIRLYKNKKVDGLIIVPFQNEKYEELNLSLLRQVEKESIPYILIDGYLDKYPTDAVITNNEEMGYLLTKHLLEQGYSRIAFIARPYFSSIRDRLKGYRRALKETGISYEKDLVVFAKGRFQEDAYLLAEKLLSKQKPDAFFGVNDCFALGAFQAIEEVGLKVPEDIGLVGFDDSIIATQSKVPLTTARQPKQEIGQEAIKLFRKRMENLDKKPEKVVIPSKLIIRQSSLKKM